MKKFYFIKTKENIAGINNTFVFKISFALNFFKNSITLLIMGLLICTINSCSNLNTSSVLLSDHNYGAAIPIIEKYIQQNPDSIEANRQLAYAYFKTGQLKKAEESFNYVLKKNPDNAFSVLYLGLLYVKNKNFQNAINIWQGYKNNNQPKLEKEIKKQLTLLQIAESRKAAKQALANEQSLGAVKTNPNSVAVFYYKDMTGNNELKQFQKGLAAMIMTGLSKIDKIKVVERLRMQALLQEMSLGQTGLIDEKTAPRIGKLLGAEKLIVGSMTHGIQTTSSVASTLNQDILGTETITIQKEQFFEMPVKIIQKTAKYFGIDLSIDEIELIKSSMTTNYDAFMHYCNAIDYFDLGDWEKSAQALEKAVQEDPEFGQAKELQESCPPVAAPKIEKLIEMPPAQISKLVTTSIDNVMTGGIVKEAELIEPEPPKMITVSNTFEEPEVQEKQEEETDEETNEEISEEIHDEYNELPEFPGLPN